MIRLLRSCAEVPAVTWSDNPPTQLYVSPHRVPKSVHSPFSLSASNELANVGQLQNCYTTIFPTMHNRTKISFDGSPDAKAHTSRRSTTYKEGHHGHYISVSLPANIVFPSLNSCRLLQRVLASCDLFSFNLNDFEKLIRLWHLMRTNTSQYELKKKRARKRISCCMYYFIIK